MSASRDKGTKWETAVVGYLREHGFPFVERRAMRGRNDGGDIAGLVGWVLECKNEARASFGAYLTETERSASNVRAPWFAAIVKRRGKPVGDAYVVLPLRVLADVLRDLPIDKRARLDPDSQECPS